MLNKDQAQSASNNSVAVQAGRDVVITGMTYAEVRQVALDVCRANLLELKGIAESVAKERAEEITDNFLTKLQAKNPEGLSKAQDPGFQYDLFTVQREYAKTGDRELGDLLVDLLVDRSKLSQRDILQIVLSESLNTAPKLTEQQLAALAVMFLFKHTQNQGIGTLELLGNYLDRHVAPFASKLVKSMACYQHLQFTGCGSIGSFPGPGLETILGNVYQGLFLKGFEAREIADHGISLGLDQRVFVTCLNDQSKVQVKAMNTDQLDKLLDFFGIAEDDRTKIRALFGFGKMTDAEIKDKVISLRPYMSNVFEIWSGSSIGAFTLTSVGIAIGHANIQRLVGPFADLSIWIN